MDFQGFAHFRAARVAPFSRRARARILRHGMAAARNGRHDNTDNIEDRTMGAAPAEGRITVREIAARKGGAPVVCLTAYTAPVARALDRHVDLLLVGDSLAMVIYGMDSTRGVTLDMMIAHGRAVTRASAHACVVIDLPYGSYEAAPEDALSTARRVMVETGAQAIKLEGGTAMAETVHRLVDAGIPVMGHVGLLPQSAVGPGGYRVRGRDPSEAGQILADAQAIAEAGAFSIVVENVVEPLGRAITEAIAVPSIGIGASPACDGQVLVTDDMLGLFTDFTPHFVKRYAALADEIARAAAAYAADVAARRFPGPEHCRSGND